MEDLLKQFLPTGFSLEQHWLKLTVYLATVLSAWLVSKTGMDAEMARYLVAGLFATGIVTIASIAHAQASRLKGAASVASAQQTSTTPDTQVNVGPGVNVATTTRQPTYTPPAPAPEPVPQPPPAPQVVQLTPAQLQAFLSRAVAAGIAQHKAAAVAQQDTVAGQHAA